MAAAFIKLGTRGSPLALAQAHEVRRRLSAHHQLAAEQIEIVVIRTTGDQIQDRALSEAGGKGLFTKELDQALIEGAIDLAVHSSKDLPTFLPPAIAIIGYLPREDARDAFISAKAKTLLDLPEGAKLGSASLRRQAMALRLRPDLKITLLRGNVETRLRKVESGEIDATLLAIAGLNRLGLAHRATSLLSLDDFVPAAGQGAVGITCRKDDINTHSLIQAICDPSTLHAVTAERAFLTVLDGSCRTPIGGHATIIAAELNMSGIVLSKTGNRFFTATAKGAITNAAAIGIRAAHDILNAMPDDFLK
jgi:hydroxymethylbilane synthase